MQQINRNGVNSLFNRKNDEVLDKRVKNEPRTNIGKIQKCLMNAFLYKKPNGTAGEFAQFHNKAMVEMKIKQMHSDNWIKNIIKPLEIINDYKSLAMPIEFIARKNNCSLQFVIKVLHYAMVEHSQQIIDCKKILNEL